MYLTTATEACVLALVLVSISEVASVKRFPTATKPPPPPPPPPRFVFANDEQQPIPDLIAPASHQPDNKPSLTIGNPDFAVQGAAGQRPQSQVPSRPQIYQQRPQQQRPPTVTPQQQIPPQYNRPQQPQQERPPVPSQQRPPQASQQQQPTRPSVQPQRPNSQFISRPPVPVPQRPSQNPPQTAQYRPPPKEVDYTSYYQPSYYSPHPANQ